jgi:hypothetical protein
MIAFYDFPFDFLTYANKAINKAIQECYPRFWTENDITTAILRQLVTNNRIFSISNNSRSIEKTYTIIEWDVFKLTGKMETDAGDVACYVHFIKSDMPDLVGIGFFESKKIYESGEFSGIKSREQLERMIQFTPHHHTVLYDYNYLEHINDHPHALYGYQANCGSIPSNLLIALNNKSRDVYNYSFTLAELLCCRYFCGLDLEFNPAIVERVMSPREPYESDPPAGGSFIPKPSHLLVAFISSASSEEKLSSILHLRHIKVPRGYSSLSDGHNFTEKGN